MVERKKDGNRGPKTMLMRIRLAQVIVTNLLVTIPLAIFAVVYAPLAFLGVRRRAAFFWTRRDGFKQGDCYCREKDQAILERLEDKYAWKNNAEFEEAVVSHCLGVISVVLAILFSQKLAGFYPGIAAHRPAFPIAASFFVGASASILFWRLLHNEANFERVGCSFLVVVAVALLVALLVVFPRDFVNWFGFVGWFGWVLLAVALMLAARPLIVAIWDIARVTRVRLAAEIRYTREQSCPNCGAEPVFVGGYLGERTVVTRCPESGLDHGYDNVYEGGTPDYLKCARCNWTSR